MTFAAFQFHTFLLLYSSISSYFFPFVYFNSHMQATAQQQRWTIIALPWCCSFIVKYLSVVTCNSICQEEITFHCNSYMRLLWVGGKNKKKNKTNKQKTQKNKWIIPEVILLFWRLTRTVQLVSRERVCLWGLRDRGLCVLENGLRCPYYTK